MRTNARTYEETHPWLDFSLDLRRLSHETWALLGEAVSKMDHIAGVPLTPEAAKKLHALYLAKGVLATTAIEGNTLSEEEVRAHLEGRLRLPPSREYLAREIDNVVDACNGICGHILPVNDFPLSSDDIKDYNRLILRDLSLPEEVRPGQVRNYSIAVGRYRGVPAEDCDYLLNRLCEWLNEIQYPKELQRHCAILTAIVAHIYFVWIHPFGDGNGRTARLLEFRFLLQAGFPLPAAHLLSDFYNLTRTEYYRQLDAASRSGGKMDSFIAYAVQGLVDQLKEQLAVIRKLQWETTWKNYVYEMFSHKTTAAQIRRRRLVLELSKVGEHEGWVSVAMIPQLSAKLATEYAGRTSKTIGRDLNEVVKMELVERGSGGLIRANKKLILAFLPARAVNTNDALPSS